MTSISARAQAIEDLLRQDQSDDESFDYDAFIRTRNTAQAPKQPATFGEIRAQLEAENLEPEPEQVYQRNAAIESDSEEEQENEEPAPRTRTIDDQSDSESEDEVEQPKQPKQSKQNESNLPDEPSRAPKSRKARVNADQGLARMKRQLDIDIAVYTKTRPTVADFVASFHPNTAQDEESDLEIVSDAETCPTSPIIPFKHVPDTRQNWFRNLHQLQSEQQKVRHEENLKQFELEEEPLAEDPEEEPELEVDQALPSVTPDAAQLDLSGDEDARDEVASNAESDTELVAHHASDELATVEETDLPSSNDTVMNETQVAAPVDPKQLRELYQKQRKIFNDSDSESEDDQDDQDDQQDEGPSPLSSPPLDREELDKLSPAQQQEELRRRFQMKRELALEMLEEQAQESDEDLDITRAPGDTDDDEDDNEAPVENLIDDTKQIVQEDDLHAMFVERERELDDKIAKSIRKDVIGGGWRSKHLFDETGMIDDDDDDDDENNQRFKRARRLQRERILEHSVIGKLAANSKTKAFAESMVEELVDRDTLGDSCESIQESLRFLSEGHQPDLPSSQGNEATSDLDPAPPVVSVVTSLRKSTCLFGSRDRGRDSVLSRALPSAHSVPVLANKHINRRARISEPNSKPQKLTCKSIGIGYKRSWS